jgi:hypothetical protein
VVRCEFAREMTATSANDSTETRPETGTETETGAELETTRETGTGPETELQTEAETETGTGTETETETGAELETTRDRDGTGDGGSPGGPTGRLRPCRVPCTRERATRGVSGPGSGAVP